MYNAHESHRLDHKCRIRSIFLWLLSGVLLLTPVLRIIAAKWNNLFLLDLAAYCAVSKALYTGLNPFPNHMDVLMFSFGNDVPIVYPGQMLLFAIPGCLWCDAIQIAYIVVNIFIVYFLTALTLVKACGYTWQDFLRPGLKQFAFSLSAFLFLSSWNVLQTMRVGQIPVILAFCLYGIFWFPRPKFFQPLAFAVIAVAKYSLLTVFAPLLFLKGHRRLCLVAFVIFLILSLSPVLCGNSLLEVYSGYFEAVVNLFKPEGVDHYSQTGITSCHLGFFRSSIANQIMKGVAAVPIIWLLWRERGVARITDTLLLSVFSLTMLVSYHGLHDYSLIFPLFFIRLFAFAKEKNWRYFVITACFPAYLAIPGRVVEKVGSLLGSIPHVGVFVWLSNPRWSECRDIFPLTAVFAIALAIWSLHLYRRVSNTYVFRV